MNAVYRMRWWVEIVDALVSAKYAVTQKEAKDNARREGLESVSNAYRKEAFNRCRPGGRSTPFSATHASRPLSPGRSSSVFGGRLTPESGGRENPATSVGTVSSEKKTSSQENPPLPPVQFDYDAERRQER